MDEAWIAFNPGFLDRFALRMLATHPSNDPDLAADSRLKSLKGWLPESWEARQNKLRITTNVQRSYLLDDLYADRLWAIGFLTTPEGFDEPVRVPRRYFFVDYDHQGPEIPDREEFFWKRELLLGRGSVHWRKGEIAVGDVCYFDIRIATNPNSGSAHTPVHPTNERPPATAHKRGGRPNSKREITKMAEELLELPDFQSLPSRTHQARELRARLLGEESRIQDQRPGYSTDFLKRIIGSVAASRRQT